MERMGPSHAGQENGDGTSAGRSNAVRGTAVTVALVAALAGCSVTVQPKNAAASRPLSSSPSPSAVSSSAPSTSASSSASPTPTPSDVDHAACTNVREALQTLQAKLETDKDSARHTATDYRNAGYSLRSQAAKTKNSDLKSTLETVASDYMTVGSEAANHESTAADLTKAADASKPLSSLCGGGSGGSSSGAGAGSSTSN